MESKRELIKRALDTTNAAMSSNQTAINPTIWDTKLREFQEAALVMTPLAEQFDFRGAGSDYTVTVDAAPAAAALLVETTDVSVTAFSTRNLTFTPKEYGQGYQLTKQEASRAFFNVADRMVRKLGYALALKKDSLAISTVTSGATSTVIVNSKTNVTDLAATDVLNLPSITKAKQTIETLHYVPTEMVINYGQKKALLDNANVTQAHQFGTRSGIEKGLIGELYGLQVFATENIGAASHVVYALVLGKTRSGEKAFGYAVKRDPQIEKQYFARGRFWDVVATEEYDFQVIHPDAICKIATYE